MFDSACFNETTLASHNLVEFVIAILEHANDIIKRSRRLRLADRKSLIDLGVEIGSLVFPRVQMLIDPFGCPTSD